MKFGCCGNSVGFGGDYSRFGLNEIEANYKFGQHGRYDSLGQVMGPTLVLTSPTRAAGTAFGRRHRRRVVGRPRTRRVGRPRSPRRRVVRRRSRSPRRYRRRVVRSRSPVRPRSPRRRRRVHRFE
uniref:Uncharacterized protein n=1 Tax=viral metagenome TaxID=1070528 RepID=A0A6C0CR47_9ZZZZ